MFQIPSIEDTLNWESMLTPLIELVIIFAILILMIYVIRYNNIWYIVLSIFLFSLIIGGVSILRFDLPFTPFIQILFILIQTIFFLDSTNKMVQNKKGKYRL